MKNGLGPLSFWRSPLIEWIDLLVSQDENRVHPVVLVPPSVDCGTGSSGLAQQDLVEEKSSFGHRCVLFLPSQILIRPFGLDQGFLSRILVAAPMDDLGVLRSPTLAR